MRVVLFAHRLEPPDPTGVARYVRELSIALSRAAGNEDLALTLASPPEAAAPEWVPPEIEVRRAAWPRQPKQIAWSLGAGPRLERSLGPADVVHLLQPFPPARSDAPQVLTVHDVLPFEHRDWYSTREWLSCRRGTAVALPRAARIVAPTEHVAGRLQSLFGIEPERIAVVPHGVSGDFSLALSEAELARACRRFGLSPGRFAICLGELSPRKNAVTLVRAAHALSERGITLVLAGRGGPDAARVDAEIARLGAEAHVVRTGYLDQSAASALVQAAGVLVHPALGEGFGFVPLEAMAAGTPVIASGSSSIPEVAGDAAVLIDDPLDPHAWAHAITGVIGDEGWIAELAAAGVRRAAGFTWARAATAMLAIYREATCI